MKNKFGVIVTSRGIFPEHLVKQAREEIQEALARKGIGCVMLPFEETPNGAVQTFEDAQKCAALFRQHAKDITGILISLPNFGEEAPVYTAVRQSGLNVPILIQAYDDRYDALSIDERRDSFCGKLSVCNNLYYAGIKFTGTTLHTCMVTSEEFAEDLEYFSRVCMVVHSMRHARIGLLGMRPDGFRTVRFSEKILQNNGITTCVADLSEIIAAASRVTDKEQIAQVKKAIKAYGKIGQSVAEEKIELQAKLILAVRRWLADNQCDAYAMQCWNSLEFNYGCAACLSMSMLGEDGIPGACESDVMGAVTMLALNRAAGMPSAYMDWNNNFTEDRDVCINQHCGNFPKSFFGGEIEISYLDVLAKSIEPERCFGACKAQTAPGDMTFCKVTTDDNQGCIKAYFGEGELLGTPVPSFGALSLWKVPQLQKLLSYLCQNGFEHHVAVVRGNCGRVLEEAFGKYMGWQIYKHG